MQLKDIRKVEDIPAHIQETPIGDLLAYHNLGAPFKEYTQARLLIAVGGVRHIALIGHTQCGMVNLVARRNAFVEGLVNNGGWTPERAIEHFQNFAPLFEIDNEITFTLAEARRLNEKYPKVTTVPLLYKVEDNHLYLIED
jgi:carbonic anhydrase